MIGCLSYKHCHFIKQISLILKYNMSDLTPSSKAASDGDETNKCHEYLLNEALQPVNPMAKLINHIYLMRVQLLSIDASDFWDSNDYRQFVFVVDSCNKKLVDVYDWQLFTFKATLVINVFCIFT